MLGIYHQVLIKADPERVFQMLTESNGLNSWWTIKSSGRAELGSCYRFYFSDEYDWRAEVDQVQQGISISWRFTVADEDWTSTLLKFVLIPEGRNATLLQLDHTNWRERNQHFRRTSYCWVLYLEKLRQLLEHEI